MVFFIFIQILNRSFCKQIVETLIRRRVLRRLHCLSVYHKKDARLIWANHLVAEGIADCFSLFLLYLYVLVCFCSGVSFSPCHGLAYGLGSAVVVFPGHTHC